MLTVAVSVTIESNMERTSIHKKIAYALYIVATPNKNQPKTI